MKTLIKYSTFGAAAAAFAATATPAFADPQHCPPGHAKKGWCTPGVKHDRYDDRRDEQRAYNEGYEDGQRAALRYDGRDYYDYRMIRDYDRYGLSAPRAGYGYAEIDGDIVMVQLATQLITEFLR